MRSAKTNAILALMAAEPACPSHLDHEAFWEYQNKVMEPLREAIREEAA